MAASISSRIEAIKAMLDPGRTREPLTDEQLARKLAHARVVDQFAGINDGPFADLVFVPGQHRDNYVLEKKTLSPSGSLDQFLGTSERTVVTRQRDPDIGPDGYYTREYEQARMERVTQRGGTQQTRPITSKWRRN